MPGQAFGRNRDYQVLCRDVLVHRNPTLRPWSGDGIDVPFDLPDTQWTIDVALRGDEGLVVAECRRTASSVKQEDVAAFAYKVELLRRTQDTPVAASFFTKTGHQVGAVKVGQFTGIEHRPRRGCAAAWIQHEVPKVRCRPRAGGPGHCHAHSACLHRHRWVDCRSNRHQTRRHN